MILRQISTKKLRVKMVMSEVRTTISIAREMVVHTAAQLVEYVSVPQLIGGSVAAAGIWSVKAWAGGRKCIWEREWAGKMIMVVVSGVDRSMASRSPDM